MFARGGPTGSPASGGTSLGARSVPWRRDVRRQLLRRGAAGAGRGVRSRAVRRRTGSRSLRRRRDAERRAVTAGARSAKVKGASRAVAAGRTRDGELVQVPFARSVAFCALGFVMMVAGIASLTI